MERRREGGKGGRAWRGSPQRFGGRQDDKEGMSLDTSPSQVPPTVASRPRVRVIGARSSGPSCKQHAERVAEYRCSKCGTYHCVECARFAEFQGSTLRVCACSGACDSLEDRIRVRGRTRFSTQLIEAMRWPFTREAMPSLVIGALLYAFLAFISGGGGSALLAPIGWALGCAATGYAIEFGFSIIAKSAQGDDEMPDWPDVADVWEGFVRPFLVVIALSAACAAPCAVVMLLTGGLWAVALPFAVCGYLVFTLACASLALGGGFEALYPGQLLRLFQDNARATFATMLALLVLGVSHLSIQAILTLAGGYVPFVPSILASFASLYALVLGARWLGLMLRERAARAIERSS